MQGDQGEEEFLVDATKNGYPFVEVKVLNKVVVAGDQSEGFLKLRASLLKQMDKLPRQEKDAETSKKGTE
jgi:hypothetical protein